MPYISAEMLAVLVGGMILFLGITINALRPRKRIQIADRVEFDQEKAALDNMLKDIEISGSVASRDDHLNWFQRKDRELKQSNVGMTLPVYLVIMGLSMMAIFVAVYMIMQLTVVALAASFLGMLIPQQVVSSKLKKNVEAFNTQLVKALRRMSSVMRSGGSLKQALMDVSRARSMPMSVRLEFKRVLTDVEYGDPIEAALYKLYERTGSVDVQFLAIAVEIQRQLGGNMAQMFDTISSTISNRNLMQSDVKATLAQAKGSGTMLSAIPFAMVGILFVISPGYFDPLFATVMGRFVFLGCLMSIVIGIFIMRKITHIDM